MSKYPWDNCNKPKDNKHIINYGIESCPRFTEVIIPSPTQDMTMDETLSMYKASMDSFDKLYALLDNQDKNDNT